MDVSLKELYVVSFQRQQVVLTEHWAKSYPMVHFSVMHPGWVDTPGTVTKPSDINK